MNQNHLDQQLRTFLGHAPPQVHRAWNEYAMHELGQGRLPIIEEFVQQQVQAQLQIQQIHQVRNEYVLQQRGLHGFTQRGIGIPGPQMMPQQSQQQQMMHAAQQQGVTPHNYQANVATTAMQLGNIPSQQQIMSTSQQSAEAPIQSSSGNIQTSPIFQASGLAQESSYYFFLLPVFSSF